MPTAETAGIRAALGEGEPRRASISSKRTSLRGTEQRGQKSQVQSPGDLPSNPLGSSPQHSGPPAESQSKVEGIDRPRGVKNTDGPRQRGDESGEEESQACPKGRTSRASAAVSVGAGEESTVGDAVTSVTKPAPPPNPDRRSRTVAVGNESPDSEHPDRQIHAAEDLIESSAASYTQDVFRTLPWTTSARFAKKRRRAASRRKVDSKETRNEHEVHRDPAWLNRGDEYRGKETKRIAK